jgi:hypothetical protein
MIFSVLFVVLAAVIASFVSENLDIVIYEQFVEEPVRTRLTEYVNDVYEKLPGETQKINEISANYHSGVLTANEFSDIIDEKATEWLESIKNYLKTHDLPFDLKLSDGNFRELVENFSETDTNDKITVLENPVERTVDVLIDNALRPTAVRIIGSIIFIVTFAVMSILLGVLLKVLGIIHKIPILGTVNRTAGALLGLLVAAAIIWIAAHILEFFITRSPDSVAFLDDSYVYDIMRRYLL